MSSLAKGFSFQKASPVDQVSASDQPVELVPDNIALEAYNKVFYPSKSDIRYNSLMQDCKQVVAFAQDNPHLYRRFKVMLSQFLASANDRDQRAGHAPRTAAANRIHDNAVIRAPITKAKKRGRPSSNDDRNLSALNICKQGKHSNKACSLCRNMASRLRIIEEAPAVPSTTSLTSKYLHLEVIVGNTKQLLILYNKLEE